ncbi:MAG TPA: hypothetical protein VMT00_08070 [Thermoanaerobaculia bacterium]|nr:hypothetical protein [Thermoanaerobaculia bacterium]
MSSDYLFSDPSFLHGTGRVFDPFGLPEPYNWSATPAEADAHAMALDWGMVGKDLADAIAELNAPDPKQLALFDPSGWAADND